MTALYWLVPAFLGLALVFCGLGYRAYRERDGGVETHLWAGFACIIMALVVAFLTPYFQRLMDALQ